jgi:DNA-binding CsgD family transcriptional regulator
MSKPPRPSPDPARLINSLSAREREIADLVSVEMMDKEIAPLLGISVSTVRMHLRHASKKLKVRGRVGIAILWLRYQK